ncbi:thioesterase-like superfamily domain-containing protein [Trichoderma breve]|uniref:Thioesterase-like superfamily domain-containing protein n=1 Tax=Trichoderma breve TaxID=2034170 RepID=A0A9W9E1H1_9HYPO|nr:thioesterase-like superfamily domain-containing protein [Trichoderma breve]KAJ4854388.1 thioesterase-like superfamily domain-containing protein [Trichoderma breve]
MASNKDAPAAIKRNDLYEALRLSRLPDQQNGSQDPVKRFVSRTPAWRPGNELPWGSIDPEGYKKGNTVDFNPAAFGGHVFAQAPLAAARAVEEEENGNGNDNDKLGIHSIQGVFTKAGAIDRPFIYDVTNVHSSRSFTTKLVQARQPTEASDAPNGPFPESDANRPLGPVSFTCLTTFKRPIPMPSPAELQIKGSAQERYADILSQRAPDQWEPSPQVDVDAVTRMFPNAGHGGFPMLDMYKVDMKAYNADKDVPERRELILYRSYKPIREDDPNAHIVAHAYEADRNGLIMLTNHLGWGFNLGSAASLSYSFYVHVNADEAVMKGDGWWIQEVWWPRVSAGRAMMEVRIWSPEGKHVASGYQDGVALPSSNLTKKKKKMGEKL